MARPAGHLVQQFQVLPHFLEAELKRLDPESRVTAAQREAGPAERLSATAMIDSSLLSQVRRMSSLAVLVRKAVRMFQNHIRDVRMLRNGSLVDEGMTLQQLRREAGGLEP